MRRSLSPMLQRELENLDKDSASRKLAMKALRSYVKELDSKAIPYFLAQVSERKESSSSGEHAISLYEVLARVHGTKIVPQIDNIMSTIIKTLSSSAGSFALHQACSKVVPAIARYGIEPTTPDDKKRCIVGSLCKPLSDSLLGSQESLSSGAALCLKALVDCDNWRYASNEMVNDVCQRVAGALEKHVQSNSHMALVMSLAKRNSFIVEAYARLLIHIGIHILNNGVTEGNSQKRLTAIHMLNTLMRCLDQKSILSEVGLIIEEMEKFQDDQMSYVSGAAFEALKTAKSICIEKSPKCESDTSSNYIQGGNCRRNILSSGRQSPLTASQESQTIDSFLQCNSFVDSPVSVNQSSQCLGGNHRSGSRKLWSRPETGVVDVSLEDGILSEAIHAIASQNNDNDDISSQYGDNADDFSGFSVGPATNENSRSTTPSPQRSHINVDNVKIFTTPRKLISSLRELDDMISEDGEKKSIRYCKSPSSRKLEWGTPASKHERRCHCNSLNTKVEGDENSSATDEQFQTRTESVSSTENVSGQQALVELKPGNATELRLISVASKRWEAAKLICGIFMILFAVLVFLFCIEDEKANYNLVPT
ncbi:hypothetical protein Leryth_009470 [Lithospermum erythrorhizon]|nr:hypothetical protein Leryth_009470 [Lithospermum erythrorhizon]